MFSSGPGFGLFGAFAHMAFVGSVESLWTTPDTGFSGFGFTSMIAEGASHAFWLGDCDAAIPSINGFGPTVVFEAAFDGGQGGDAGIRP